jgi:hypothetical protein
MRYYFEDHGCLRCDKTSVIYGGNRFCEPCRQMLQYHIQASLKRAAFEKSARVGASYPSGDFDSAAETAQRFIGRVNRR